VLQEGTKRLLHVFAERCSAIGMRGAFSAEVARQNGARNLVVIGCPSNFLNTADADLGRRVAARLRAGDAPYRPAFSLDLFEHLAAIVRRCVGWIQEWGGYIVCQNPTSAVALALGEAGDLDAEEREGFARIVLGRPYDAVAERFFLNRCVAFFDAEAWMAFLRPSRFALGTRLHGNLLALQCGVPAAIVPHDARTREVAETVGMPIVEPEGLLTAPSLPALIAGLGFDGEAYDRRRAELAAAYCGLFAAAGIPLSPEIGSLRDRILGEAP
jgi:Polysaccharide pyruvyl transferase